MRTLLQTVNHSWLGDSLPPFVYISDGGHLDNEAILEALRRKAAFIVVVDGGADPEFGCDALLEVFSAHRDRVRFTGVEVCVDDLDRQVNNFRANKEQSFLKLHVRYYCTRDGSRDTLLGRGVIYYLHLRAPRGGPDQWSLGSVLDSFPNFVRGGPVSWVPDHDTSNQSFHPGLFAKYKHLGFELARDVLHDAWSITLPSPDGEWYRNPKPLPRSSGLLRSLDLAHKNILHILLVTIPLTFVTAAAYVSEAGYGRGSPVWYAVFSPLYLLVLYWVANLVSNEGKTTLSPWYAPILTTPIIGSVLAVEAPHLSVLQVTCLAFAPALPLLGFVLVSLVRIAIWDTVSSPAGVVPRVTKSVFVRGTVLDGRDVSKALKQAYPRVSVQVKTTRYMARIILLAGCGLVLVFMGVLLLLVARWPVVIEPQTLYKLATSSLIMLLALAFGFLSLILFTNADSTGGVDAELLEYVLGLRSWEHVGPAQGTWRRTRAHVFLVFLALMFAGMAVILMSFGWTLSGDTGLARTRWVMIGLSVFFAWMVPLGRPGIWSPISTEALDNLLSFEEVDARKANEEGRRFFSLQHLVRTINQYEAIPNAVRVPMGSSLRVEVSDDMLQTVTAAQTRSLALTFTLVAWVVLGASAALSLAVGLPFQDEESDNPEQYICKEVSYRYLFWQGMIVLTLLFILTAVSFSSIVRPSSVVGTRVSWHHSIVRAAPVGVAIMVGMISLAGTIIYFNDHVSCQTRVDGGRGHINFAFALVLVTAFAPVSLGITFAARFFAPLPNVRVIDTAEYRHKASDSGPPVNVVNGSQHLEDDPVPPPFASINDLSASGSVDSSDEDGSSCDDERYDEGGRLLVGAGGGSGGRGGDRYGAMSESRPLLGSSRPVLGSSRSSGGGGGGYLALASSSSVMHSRRRGSEHLREEEDKQLVAGGVVLGKRLREGMELLGRQRKVMKWVVLWAFVGFQVLTIGSAGIDVAGLCGPRKRNPTVISGLILDVIAIVLASVLFWQLRARITCPDMSRTNRWVHPSLTWVFLAGRALQALPNDLTLFASQSSSQLGWRTLLLVVDTLLLVALFAFLVVLSWIEAWQPLLPERRMSWIPRSFFASVRMFDVIFLVVVNGYIVFDVVFGRELFGVMVDVGLASIMLLSLFCAVHIQQYIRSLAGKVAEAIESDGSNGFRSPYSKIPLSDRAPLSLASLIILERRAVFMGVKRISGALWVIYLLLGSATMLGLRYIFVDVWSDRASRSGFVTNFVFSLCDSFYVSVFTINQALLFPYFRVLTEPIWQQSWVGAD